MNLTKGQIMLINNMVNTELSNKNTVYNPTELVNLKEQLILSGVSNQRELLIGFLRWYTQAMGYKDCEKTAPSVADLYLKDNL